MGKFIELIKKYPLYKVSYNEKKFVAPLSETEMCCPFCGHPLVRRGWKRLETTAEHVSNPNATPSEKPAYYCENEECRYKDVFLWNGPTVFSISEGEAFFNSDKAVVEVDGEKKVDDKYWELYKETSDWYTAATNTFTFKQQREETKKIYLHPIFALFLLRPFIEVYYEAKENGEIVGSKWRLHFLKKDGNKGDYCIYYISSIHMFFHEMKCRRLAFKRLKLSNDSFAHVYSRVFRSAFGNDSFVPKSHFTKKDWYRTASWNIMRFFHRKTYKNSFEILKNKFIDEYGKSNGKEKYNDFLKEFFK